MGGRKGAFLVWLDYGYELYLEATTSYAEGGFMVTSCGEGGCINLVGE
jgi:hypothetical protein